MRYLLIAVVSVALFFPVAAVVTQFLGDGLGFGLAAFIMYIGFPYAALKLWKGKTEPYEAEHRILVDDNLIRSIYPDDSCEEISWKDIALVEIVTNNEGPWHDDAFWLFHNIDGKTGCSIPVGASNEELILDKVHSKLSGFDDEKFIEAMGCTDNQKFTVWRKTV